MPATSSSSSKTQTTSAFRPPAVPLVTLDPFLSIWSFTNKLNEGATRHWTGSAQHFYGFARIDGQSYSFCDHNKAEPHGLGMMIQTQLDVLPTRTLYTFEAGGIRLTLTFLTPALPHDLDWLSRPITYFIHDITVIDGQSHDVSLYWDIGGEIATESINEDVTWRRLRLAAPNKDSAFDIISISAADQRVLGGSGDLRRIEWGHAYLALPPLESGEASGEIHLGPRAAARRHFASTGHLPVADDLNAPRAITDHWPAMAAMLPFGRISPSDGSVRKHFILAYDDIFSIEYLHRKLRPWWRRNGADAAQLLHDAITAFPAIEKTCADYDTSLMHDLRARGGDDYARVCALAFRQCLAAHKLVADLDGTPLYFSKENHSNGCIATVDVTYPSSPFFLALNPALLRAQLDPILTYASLPRWRFPFAPHDIGTYPLANGQVYGGGELSEDNQMPVEECGNMLILISAYSLYVKKETGIAYARHWWPLLRQWAGYLEQKGLDPENQLCTDDFAGHLAHNTNLSLKAIVALGAYARLVQLIGEKDESERIRRIAQDMALRWQQMALDDDGTHYRLAFDAPGTWSQKYNLIWDRLLSLNLFPAEVARKELAFYRTKQQLHGLPLDSRKTYTKLDWIFWTACLTNNDDDFHALIAPACAWVSAGTTRVPLTDWYETTGDGRQVGFQARSVVGGLFIRQLEPAKGTD